MESNFKTLQEYFYPASGDKCFVVPNYQRGYKWSVRPAQEQTSVEYLMDSLLEAYKTPDRQYFLQGVTVAEDGKNIILIDGQQRTTTLYLLLWCLGVQYITGTNNINLDYSIRDKSRAFIHSLKEGQDCKDDSNDNNVPDICCFKDAIKQIQDKIKNMSQEQRDDFYQYIMKKVCLLYIVVDKSMAVRIFTMMNGNKATMLDEELTKAEMLHLVSLPAPIKIKEQCPLLDSNNDTFHALGEMWDMADEAKAIEWETNALRSRYAREWDKWLYWWNRGDVKEYFGVRKPMGLLLEYYYRKECAGVENGESRPAYSFKSFRKLMPDNDKRAAKNVFKGLRDLQKDFEDIFDNPLSYNYLKCAMIGSNNIAEDKYNIIMYFIKNKHSIDLLKRYARWRMLGSTHIETTEEYTNDPTAENQQRSNKDIRQNRLQETIQCLSEAQVYGKYDDTLCKQLLRLNVKEYNQLNGGKGVKFDFSIWNNKSIEHIYPKSRFYHEEIDETTGETRYITGAGTEVQNVEGLLNSKIAFKENPDRYSEHCIGNLVLLYGRDNSAFGALSFEEKKKKFFNNEIAFTSRNLLHTISSFANGTWTPADIEKAAEQTITIIKNDYNELDHE